MEVGWLHSRLPWETGLKFEDGSRCKATKHAACPWESGPWRQRGSEAAPGSNGHVLQLWWLLLLSRLTGKPHWPPCWALMMVPRSFQGSCFSLLHKRRGEKRGRRRKSGRPLPALLFPAWVLLPWRPACSPFTWKPAAPAGGVTLPSGLRKQPTCFSARLHVTQWLGDGINNHGF